MSKPYALAAVLGSPPTFGGRNFPDRSLDLGHNEAHVVGNVDFTAPGSVQTRRQVGEAGDLLLRVGSDVSTLMCTATGASPA